MKGRRGGVWVAIKPHCAFPAKYEVCEPKLLRKNGHFILHLTVQKNPQPNLTLYLNPSKLAVIACDIGEATPIMFVVWWNGTVQEVAFHATEAQATRAHYSHLH
ncbi:MAG: hypothetical protein ACE5R6_00225 [Candidatus Heimdallarchaeota archaeon]